MRRPKTLTVVRRRIVRTRCNKLIVMKLSCGHIREQHPEEYAKHKDRITCLDCTAATLKSGFLGVMLWN